MAYFRRLAFSSHHSLSWRLFMGPPPPVGGAFSAAKVVKSGEKKSDSCKATFTHVVEISERKSSTHIWGGVQPWDLSRCPGRIESYPFIMESSIFKPYSASLKFMHAGKLAVALSTS